MNPPTCVRAECKSPVIYLAVAMETGNASCCVVSEINCVSIDCYIRRCIQKSQDNAHNIQVACSSLVSR